MRGRRAIVMATLLAGCINEDVRLYEVVLTGEVRASDPAATGRVHLELHHARRGQGELETPLGLIDTTEVEAPGATEWTTLVPLGEGEGLVLYGWIDVDGDGLLCASGAEPEPAGVVEIAGFPAHARMFTLVADTPCAGPSALYPP